MKKLQIWGTREFEHSLRENERSLIQDCQSYLEITWLSSNTLSPQVVDAAELQTVSELRGQTVLVATAAFFGAVRLIDNVVLESGAR